MVMEGEEEGDQEGHTAYQFFHYSMLQGDKLPNHQVYLVGCFMVTAFKARKYLENLCCMSRGMNINCNSGAMRTIRVGDYGMLKVWYILEGVANIFSIDKLKKKYLITYDSWEGYLHHAHSKWRSLALQGQERAPEH
jgi:hypothetical protein